MRRDQRGAARRRLGSAGPRAASRWVTGEAAHVPLRTCAGCGARVPRASMRRLGLVAGAEAVEWRDGGGRGTYLHDSPECRGRFVVGKRRLPGLRASVARAAREALIERLAVAH